uniref:Uncharacterized protein n=1 Tax=Siphoviridae sp. ctKcB20 TaxID=2827568 RepID=A0A8S5LLB1_9CAUD|nr:MAG TPA: hypothetical protein [Siphoviridae sp. ctKcB20]
MNTNEVSVCDGCSNWRICKFSEDVKRAEAEYKQLRENWPECVETTLGCKYKQYVTNRLSAYNGANYLKTGYPSNSIFNSDYTPTGSSKTTK